MRTRVCGTERLWRLSALCGLLAVGLLLLMVVAGATPARAALTPGPSFGGPGTGNGQFQQAQGAAVDPSTGDVWVVDYGTGENDGRLEKFSPSGQYLSSADAGPAGGVYGPVGVAVDPSGDVFLAESQQGAVLEFDSSGKFIQSISDQHLVSPQYVAVDPGNPNDVYVSQGAFGNVVVEYTVSGSSSSYVQTIGTSGSGALNNAQGVAINPAGDLYVADAGDNLVKEYSTAGTYIQSFGGGGDGFSGPTALTIDPLTNNLLVSDQNGVQTLDSSGDFLSSFPTSGNTSGLAVDPSSGDPYVVDGSDNEVTKFTGATGEVEQPLGTRTLGFFVGASADATDPTTGDVYIDYGNKVEKRDAGGNLISTITFLPDYVTLSNGVAVDGSGNVFVAIDSSSSDNISAEVQEYNASGTYVRTFGVNTLQTPGQLAIDPANGEVLVADSGDDSGLTSKIYAFDPSTGQLASSFAVTPAPNKPAGVAAYGIAVNATGTRVYVGDSQDELFGYTPSGTQLFEVGGQGSGAGQFQNAFDVAADPSTGSVFVVDSQNDRIERFDSSGLYLGQLSVGDGTYGVAVGLDPNASNYGDVYAVNNDTTHNSSNLFRFGKPAPASTSSPSITGTAQDGQTLSADPGTWSSPDTLTYAYQWQDCPSGGGACSNVATGGTSASYTAGPSDVGSFLQVVVSATDQQGQTGSSSVQTSGPVAKPAPPQSTSSVSITGTAQDGQTLTAHNASWSSPDTLSYSYQWQDCPSGGGTCTNVASGGVSPSYRATASDVGSLLQVVVTATDAESQTATASAQTASAVGKPAPPQNTVAPSIGGTARDGQTVTAGRGTWTTPDPLTYSYQWQDCPSGGGTCTNVASGGKLASYHVVASDVGSFLQVVLTVSDKEGQTGRATNKTATVVANPAPPQSSSSPTITGTAQDGLTVTAHNGTWSSPDPLTYAYQWQDCPSGGGTCSDVVSQGNSPSYRAVASDVNSYLQVVITATDKEHQTGTGSQRTATVVADPVAPKNTVAPAITGTVQDGHTLTASRGTWSSPDGLTYSYQWQDCPHAGGSCSNVAAGGKLESYTASASDVGSLLQVVETATDKEGQTGTAMRKTTVVVAKPMAPKNMVAPSISGTVQDGQTLTAHSGTWSSPDLLTYAYQWQDCPSAGGTCKNVAAGGMSPSYRATASDVGSVLQVLVTATDKESQTGKASDKTATVVAKPAPPQNTSAPTITGTARDGETLTAHNGSWSSPDPLTYTYQWQDCPSGGGLCSNVSANGTSASYTAGPSDVGSYLQVVVYATDSEQQAGTATRKTTAVVAKPAAPKNTAAPSISGTAQVGQKLMANNGTWSSPDTLSYKDNWQRCSSTGTGCSTLSGASGSTYVVQAADAGHELRLVVTATDQESQPGTAYALTAVVGSASG